MLISELWCRGTLYGSSTLFFHETYTSCDSISLRTQLEVAQQTANVFAAEAHWHPFPTYLTGIPTSSCHQHILVKESLNLRALKPPKHLQLLSQIPCQSTLHYLDLNYLSGLYDRSNFIKHFSPSSQTIMMPRQSTPISESASSPPSKRPLASATVYVPSISDSRMFS